jgi:RimJ/RimL family protein N-acetyltransferase
MMRMGDLGLGSRGRNIVSVADSIAAQGDGYDRAMTAESDIRVTPVTPELAPAVRALRVAAEQYAYVGDIEVNLLDAERTLESDAMAILSGDTVIGFYRIDHFPSIVTVKPLGPGAVGLRAFLIDRAWQGRGLAARAVRAVCDDLRQRHPQVRVLALNVNCRNVAAIRAYRNAGFVDTGELVFGGAGGPQHLMLRSLC